MNVESIVEKNELNRETIGGSDFADNSYWPWSCKEDHDAARKREEEYLEKSRTEANEAVRKRRDFIRLAHEKFLSDNTLEQVEKMFYMYLDTFAPSKRNLASDVSPVECDLMMGTFVTWVNQPLMQIIDDILIEDDARY